MANFDYIWKVKAGNVIIFAVPNDDYKAPTATSAARGTVDIVATNLGWFLSSKVPAERSWKIKDLLETAWYDNVDQALKLLKPALRKMRKGHIPAQLPDSSDVATAGSQLRMAERTPGIAMDDTIFFQGPDTGFGKQLTIYWTEDDREGVKLPVTVDKFDASLDDSADEAIDEEVADLAPEDARYLRKSVKEDLSYVLDVLRPFIGKQYRDADSMWRDIIHSLKKHRVEVY